MKKILNIIFLVIPFLLMDVAIRVLAMDINYSRKEMVFANILFNFIWIALIVSVTLSVKRTVGRIIYGFCFAVFFLLFLTNSVYYSYTGFFFGFHLMLLADEGSAYIWSVIANTSPVIFLVCGVILAFGMVALINFPKREKGNFKVLLGSIIAFVVLHIITPSFLGKANEDLAWDTWRNPRNVYENFNDANKNMKICGLFEYSVRDFYKTFLSPKQKGDEEDLAFLKEQYKTLTTHKKNEYTGILKGKNVIFLQLEGVDDWMFTKKDMPNLYALLEHAISFENHYSYYNGGGSTFNSELAVNAGFITPISYNQNAYTFNTNLYTDSLPKLFKEMGYSANAFHMNTGEYYARELNYVNWGYDHYYGLLDEKNYEDKSYELDRELILNETFYENLFQQDGAFMHYVITYTPHTPFALTDWRAKTLAKEFLGDDVSELSEEECARLYATETDHMIELLMQGLKDNGLYDNTVIVAYSDHYLYTLNDKSVLEQYKETDNNLINHTPFFIWSSDLKPEKIEKVNSQNDILPTVLNLFGISYTEEFYIGNDIMDDSYRGYVFFSDYSWYDGNVYVENGEVTNGKKADKAYIASMNEHINRLVQKNDLTQKYDYFRELNKSTK